MHHYNPGTPPLHKIPCPCRTLSPQLPTTVAHKPLESDAMRSQKGQCEFPKNCNVAVIFGDYPHIHGRSPKPPSRQYSPRLPSRSRYIRRAENSLDVIVFGM